MKIKKYLISAMAIFLQISKETELYDVKSEEKKE